MFCGISNARTSLLSVLFDPLTVYLEYPRLSHPAKQTVFLTYSPVPPGMKMCTKKEALTLAAFTQVWKVLCTRHKKRGNTQVRRGGRGLK
jgi:hypothetical protein